MKLSELVERVFREHLDPESPCEQCPEFNDGDCYAWKLALAVVEQNRTLREYVQTHANPKPSDILAIIDGGEA